MHHINSPTRSVQNDFRRVTSGHSTLHKNLSKNKKALSNHIWHAYRAKIKKDGYSDVADLQTFASQLTIMGRKFRPASAQPPSRRKESSTQRPQSARGPGKVGVEGKGGAGGEGGNDEEDAEWNGDSSDDDDEEGWATWEAPEWKSKRGGSPARFTPASGSKTARQPHVTQRCKTHLYGDGFKCAYCTHGWGRTSKGPLGTAWFTNRQPEINLATILKNEREEERETAAWRLMTHKEKMAARKKAIERVRLEKLEALRSEQTIGRPHSLLPVRHLIRGKYSKRAVVERVKKYENAAKVIHPPQL